MRTIFTVIGIVTVVYFLLRGLTLKRKVPESLIADTEVEQSAAGIMATLNTLSGKSLNGTKGELRAFNIDYTWEPWGKIIWQMSEVPHITFEKNKTSVSAYSTSDSSSGLYASIASIVDEEKIISDISQSEISVKLGSSATDYERLLYAKLIEMGAEVIKD